MMWILAKLRKRSLFITFHVKMSSHVFCMTRSLQTAEEKPAFSKNFTKKTSLLNQVYRPALVDEAQWGTVDLEKPLSTTALIPVIIFFHGLTPPPTVLTMTCSAAGLSVSARRWWVVSVNYG